MASAVCRVRRAQAYEMGWLLELAAEEGWNPGLHDARAFFAADPQGFFIAELDGERIGCISAVAYGPDFAFIGLYIVRAAWRGQGHGMALWRAAMAHVAGRTIGLDGVPAQQDNYRRSGFELVWNNVRFEGRVSAPSDTELSGQAPGLRPLSDIPFAQLCADDRRVFPAPRAAFLRAWIDQPNAVALAIQGPNGALAGWGLTRRCRHGHKIGPLVADTPAIAAALLDALCARLPADSLFWLDVAAPHEAAVALAQARQMRPMFETARMLTAAAAPVEQHRLYGVCTFELG